MKVVLRGHLSTNYVAPYYENLREVEILDDSYFEFCKSILGLYVDLCKGRNDNIQSLFERYINDIYTGKSEDLLPYQKCQKILKVLA